MKICPLHPPVLCDCISLLLVSMQDVAPRPTTTGRLLGGCHGDHLHLPAGHGPGPHGCPPRKCPPGSTLCPLRRGLLPGGLGPVSRTGSHSDGGNSVCRDQLLHVRVAQKGVPGSVWGRANPTAPASLGCHSRSPRTDFVLPTGHRPS